MTQALIGASPWEDDLYRHLSTHVAAEIDLLSAYKNAAEESKSAAFSYLANLIIEDERRHHRVFEELSNALRSHQSLHGVGPRDEELGREAMSRPRQRRRRPVERAAFWGEPLEEEPLVRIKPVDRPDALLASLGDVPLAVNPAEARSVLADAYEAAARTAVALAAANGLLDL